MRRNLTPAAVYVIRNLVNGKTYVGSSTDPARRWWAHRKQLADGSHGNRYLQRAYTKHGAEAFRFEIVERFASVVGLREAEQRWLDALRCCDRRFGYNIVPDTGRRVLSEETRRRMSETRRGRKLSPEHRARIRNAHTGRPKSAAHRENLRAVNLGKQLHPAHRARISQGLTGRRPTEVTRAKIAASHRGHAVSDETRRKIGDANRGRRYPARRVLTAQQCKAIRRRYADGETQVLLAREYGVSRATIYNALRRV
ncbi:MAG TPA: NUMOD3 domain-containing DNA-binding protein [Actinomycetes bacterium]|nr:NUMOD3 domain-containing DNA-binding protein [Actinomycetes bacterium]